MTRNRKLMFAAIAAGAVLIPTATFATQIVFDPTNFAEAVEQVSDDVEIVEQFQQQIQNQLSMLQNWGFTQLSGIMQGMAVWQQVFGQAGTTYTSTTPGSALNTEYPSDADSYDSMTAANYQSMENGWNQEQRNVLVENRTVQNDTYMSLQPTANRIQEYVQHSNSAPGATAATQAGNEELATVISQVQTLEAQEITDGRAEVERDAQDQAEEAYAEQQQQAVRADWTSPQQPSTSLVDAFPLANQ